jgi:hypothetical protein
MATIEQETNLLALQVAALTGVLRGVAARFREDGDDENADWIEDIVVKEGTPAMLARGFFKESVDGD